MGSASPSFGVKINHLWVANHLENKRGTSCKTSPPLKGIAMNQWSPLQKNYTLHRITMASCRIVKLSFLHREADLQHLSHLHTSSFVARYIRTELTCSTVGRNHGNLRGSDLMFQRLYFLFFVDLKFFTWWVSTSWQMKVNVFEIYQLQPFSTEPWFPYHPCIVHLPTFTIKNNQMLVNNTSPMDGMGNGNQPWNWNPTFFVLSVDLI